MEEPPFLPGPCSPELAQQRMQQCTSYFLAQLMSSPDFYDVIPRRRTKTFAWRRVALYLLGLIFAVVLSLGALQYYAGNVVDTEREPLPPLRCSFEDLAYTAHDSHLREASARLELPSWLAEELLQASTTSLSALDETSQTASPVSLVQPLMPAQSLDITPTSACALGMLFMSNQFATVAMMPMTKEVLNSEPAVMRTSPDVLQNSTVEDIIELSSVDVPADLAEDSLAVPSMDLQAEELPVNVTTSPSADVAAELTEGVLLETNSVWLAPAIRPPSHAATAPRPLWIICCALVVVVAVACLAAFAAANVDLAFVSTDNVAGHTDPEPWKITGASLVDAKPDCEVIAHETDPAATQMSTASQQSGAFSAEQLEPDVTDDEAYVVASEMSDPELLDDDELGVATADELVTVASQLNGPVLCEDDTASSMRVQSNGDAITDGLGGLSALPTGAVPSDPYDNSTFNPPSSPLLNALLYTEAESVARSGLPSISFDLSPPMAMAMLTPNEPPSPFPGFPTLSGYGVDHPSSDQPCSAVDEGSVLMAKTALDEEPEHHDLDAAATPPDSNATSWGSGSEAAARYSFTDSQVRVPGSADGHACEAPAPVVAGGRASVDPGAMPWTGFVWVDGADTPSSSASGVPRCRNEQLLATTAPACVDDSETIFDLNRFNEDGEEVVVDRKVDVTTDKMSAAQPVRRQVKLRFPSRKHMARGSDVRQADVLSTAGSSSCSSGGAQSGADRNPAEHRAVASSGDLRTPTWPPKPEVGAETPTEPDVDDAVISEALSLANSLSAGSVYGYGRGGLHWSVMPEHAYSTDEVQRGNLHQPVMEPGREYAAVATAVRMWLAKSKDCAKDVVLAACAGNEAALQASQGELHSALSEVLNLDLTPSAYTASTGACKALAYSSANTPITSQGRSSASHSADCASWASIGSKVASESPLATPSANDGVVPDGVPHLPGSDSGLAVDTNVSTWDGGPVPLPEDIDVYIASTRNKRLSPSESVVTGFQETLAYTGLLLNALSSQHISAQAKLQKLEALHSDLEEPAPPAAHTDRLFPMASESSSASLVDGRGPCDHDDGGSLADDPAVLLDSASASHSFDDSESFEEFQTPVVRPIPALPRDEVDEEVQEVVQQLVFPVIQGAEQGAEVSTPAPLGPPLDDLGVAMAAPFSYAELGDLSPMRSSTGSYNEPFVSQSINSDSSAISSCMASRVGPLSRAPKVVSLEEAPTTSAGSDVTTPQDVSHEQVSSESTPSRSLWRPQV